MAWTAGKMVAHFVAVDMSASRLVDKLTAGQQKNVNFKVVSLTTPRVPSGTQKWAAGPKVPKEVAVTDFREPKKARKLKQLKLDLLSDDEDEDPSHSARSEY